MKRLRSLQSLRWVYAILIFLHHFPSGGGSLVAWGGDCGVAFFIMLSGFVMTERYKDTAANLDWRRFMLRRIVRLEPLNLLCIAAVIALCGVVEWPGLIAQSLMVQSWAPRASIYFAGNAAAWCLADLMWCYALFPLLSRLHSSRLAALMCVAIAWAMVVPEEWVVWGVYICPMARVADFAGGILLWRAVAGGHARRQCGNPAAIQIGAVAITLIAAAGYDCINARLSLAIYWWIPSAAMIAAFAMTDGNKLSPLSRTLSAPWLTTLGDCSFGFYMLHMVVIKAYTKSDINAPLWLALPCTLIATQVLSLLICRYYEKPIAGYFQKRLF